MPRKKTLWFRFYVEAIHDRKLRRQPPATRWLWVVLLALARKSPVPGTLLLAIDGGEDDPIEIDDLVDEAALSKREVRAGMAEFERLGMLERNGDGAWVVAKWGERQFESDDATQRTRKHRSKQRSEEQGRNVPTSPDGTAEGTAPSRALATEAETEAEEPPSASGAREGLPAAIVEACRMDYPAPNTSAHSQLLAASSDIGRQGALPHEVPARARVYRARWPDATLTPHALAKHWPSLVPDKPNVPTTEDPEQARRRFESLTGGAA